MPKYKLKKEIRIGIRQKMILVLVTVLLLSLGVTGWYTLHRQEGKIIEKTQQTGKNLARITAASLVYRVIAYDYHSIQLLLDELVKSEDISYAILINSKGNIMGKAGIATGKSEPWTVFTHPIVFDNTQLGKLTLTLDNANIIKQFKSQQESIIIREILLILLISIGEFLAISYIIIRPVSIISKAFDENIDDNGIITNDIEYESKDQFGLLANQFNIMREKLNTLTKQFHSKISHTNNEIEQQNKRLLAQSAELTEVNKKLERLAVTDPLTGLFNRRHFDSMIKNVLTYADRHNEFISIILFDIDYFKLINDKYGHSSGDVVLCRIADILSKKLRKTDIAFRVGGEEFAIVCRDSDIDQSKIIAEHFRSEFAKTVINLDHEKVSITASFGIITYPGTNSCIQSPDELYHHADIAMYHSKEHGRNCISHTNDIEKESKLLSIKN